MNQPRKQSLTILTFNYFLSQILSKYSNNESYGLINEKEYSLRESVSAQGREGRGFDSDPGRKKKAIFYLVIRKSR
jgi:hypothetical protein